MRGRHTLCGFGRSRVVRIDVGPDGYPSGILEHGVDAGIRHAGLCREVQAEAAVEPLHEQHAAAVGKAPRVDLLDARGKAQVLSGARYPCSAGLEAVPQ